MNIKKIIGAMFAVITLVVVTAPALAQTAAIADTLSIKNVSIPQTSYEKGSTVTGTFDLINSGTADASAYYRVSLMGSSKNVYAMAIEGPIVLKPAETKVVTFSSGIPAGVIGTSATIHIEALTASGKPVSADQKISLTGEDRYMSLVSSNLLLDGKVVTTAPTLSRSSVLIYNASLSNQAFARFTITPRITIYKDSLIGAPIKTFTDKSVEFAHNDVHDIGFALPVASQGTYIVRIQFIDQSGLPRATESYVTYTVGNDGVIINNVTASKSSLSKGDKVDVTLVYSVSPSFQKHDNVNVSVVLYDEKKQVVASADDLISLMASSSTKVVSLVATSNARAFRAEVTVKQNDKIITTNRTVLSPNYSDALNNQAPNSQTMTEEVSGDISPASAAVVLTIIIVVVGLGIVAVKKHRMGMLMVLALISFSSVFTVFGSPQQAEAATNIYCNNTDNAPITTLANVQSAISAGGIVVSDPTYDKDKGTARITITNYTNCQMNVVWGSYKMYDMNVSNQLFYDASALINVPKQNNGVPGTASVTVSIPSCDSQMDLFLNSLATANNFAAWVRNANNQTFWPTGTNHPTPFLITYSTNASNQLILHNTILEGGAFCVGAPNTPTGLSATAACGGTINLAWTAPAITTGRATSTGYHIYRDGVTNPIATINSGSTVTYSDTTAGVGTAHTYKIDAFNATGNSAQTAATSAVTSNACSPTVPTGVTATTQACSSGSIIVSWNAVAGATGYDVYDGATQIASNIAATSFTHTGLTTGSSHSYTVVSRNSSAVPVTSAASSPAVTGTAPGACNITATLNANPPGGTATLNVTLSVPSVGGSATGNITYVFSCGNGQSTNTVGPTAATNATTPAGYCSYTSSNSYPATVQITRGGVTKTFSLSVNVNAAALIGSCSSSPASPKVGDLVTWTAAASGGTGSYTYTWSGDDSLSGSAQTTNHTYSSAGSYAASVHIVSGAQSGDYPCSTTIGAAPVSLSCTATNPITSNPIVSAPVGKPVKWVATGGSNPFTWNDGVNTPISTSVGTFTKTYISVGAKFMNLTSGGQTVACTISTGLPVTTQPNYKEF